MTKIISIANQKGGVGKTTTAVNLSSCIATIGKKVLMIDVDPQANATTGIGIEARDDGNTIYDVLILDKNMKESLRKTQIQKLDIIPSNIDLVAAELELIEFKSRESVLRRKIIDLINSLSEEERYEYVFLDCPPSLGLITVNALTAAHSVLIPVQCEYYALEGLSQLLNTIKRVKNSSNPRLSIEGYLLTMFDSRLKLANQVESELRKFFGERVFHTKIARNVKIGEAPSFGKPIIIYDPQSMGAQNYMELGKEFIRRNEAARKS
ncbi:MAG: ParA family protein [Ignavibacteria bacterium]|nr:ParA family protein [Ignavibacteria bacterium]